MRTYCKCEWWRLRRLCALQPLLSIHYSHTQIIEVHDGFRQNRCSFCPLNCCAYCFWMALSVCICDNHYFNWLHAISCSFGSTLSVKTQYNIPTPNMIVVLHGIRTMYSSCPAMPQCNGKSPKIQLQRRWIKHTHIASLLKTPNTSLHFWWIARGHQRI